MERFTFEKQEQGEPHYRGVFETLKEKIDNAGAWAKAALVGALAIGALEASGTKPRNFHALEKPKQTHDVLVGCEIGTNHACTLELTNLDQFGASWNEEKVSYEDDEEVKRLVNYTAPNEAMAGVHNAEAFSAFLEAQLSKKEILAAAHIPDHAHAENPSPDQAVRLAREIVRMNLAYDAAVARDLTMLDTLEQQGVEKGPRVEDVWNDINARKAAIDTVPFEDVYTKKQEIVCTHAARLFRENFNWLKDHHGKNLKNIYVGYQDGAGPGSLNPRAKNHIWNKIVNVQDENGDGAADRIQLLHVDATPTSEDIKKHAHELAGERDVIGIWESIRSLADLRRGGLLNREQYKDIALHFDTLLARARYQNLTPEKLLEARAAIVQEFLYGAADEAERAGFQNYMAALNVVPTER